MKYVTIKDIARELGLSFSTVSRALNDDTNIRKETREKIVKTAKAMGYVKSPVAMNLKFGYTKTIGVIAPEMSTPYSAVVIDGIQSVCYANHYKVIIASSGEDPVKERESIETMCNFMVDGIIGCRCDGRSNTDLWNDVVDRGIPLVMYDRVSPDLHVPQLVIDDETQAFFLTEHLIRIGRKRIGFIGIDEHLVYNSYLRNKGYREALERYHIPYDKNIDVLAKGMKYSDGAEAVKRLLNNDIDAVFALTDTLAIGAMNYLTDMAFRVPKEFVVAGFSGTELASIVRPSLTTVEPSQYDMGQKAANLILDIIKNRDNASYTPPERVIIDSKIVYRESTDHLYPGCFADKK